MAKKQIHEQDEALSFYLNEMLFENETKPSSKDKIEPSKQQLSNSPVDTSAQKQEADNDDSKSNSENTSPTTIRAPSADEITAKTIPAQIDQTNSSKPTTETEISDSVKASLISDIAEKDEPAVKTTTAIESKLAETSVISTQSSVDTEPAVEVEEPEAEPENKQIKLLLCDIGGMDVAVDVEQLDNIIRWPTDDLTQIPSDNDWELGLLSDREQNSNVVDIREVLQTPEQSQPFNPQFILLLAGRQWGVACSQIQQIVTEQHDEINWRQDTSQRTWFKGVLNSSMHNIVDLAAIVSTLK